MRAVWETDSPVEGCGFCRCLTVFLRFGFPSVRLQIVQAGSGNQFLPELLRDVGIVIAECHQRRPTSKTAGDLAVHRGRFNDPRNLIETECGRQGDN